MCKRGNALSLPVLIARVNLIVSHHLYPDVRCLMSEIRHSTRDIVASLLRQSQQRPKLISDICPLSLAGLVVLAGSMNPIPSRTRPLNSPAPMVLSLKAWKSRSLPGLPRTEHLFTTSSTKPPRILRGGFLFVPLHSMIFLKRDDFSSNHHPALS